MIIKKQGRTKTTFEKSQNSNEKPKNPFESQTLPHGSDMACFPFVDVIRKPNLIPLPRPRSSIQGFSWRRFLLHVLAIDVSNPKTVVVIFLFVGGPLGMHNDFQRKTMQNHCEIMPKSYFQIQHAPNFTIVLIRSCPVAVQDSVTCPVAAPEDKSS